ncbi:MAG: thiolase C-terminal domain-containing protein [Pseudomonadales bacterium]
MDRSLRGRAAVVGVGQTTYYRHGSSPHAEARLALEAILHACEDAGISPTQVDGFSSYSNDRNDGPRMAAALGCRELRFSNMFWGGGGGGAAGALQNAAAAVACGLADCVVVYRGLAQGQFGRFGRGPAAPHISGEAAHTVPYGVMSAAQMFAMKVMRFMHDHQVERSALRAIAMASYHHAQQNPLAIMHGRPLSESGYDDARWIVEPFRLYDCCQENDGAAALLVVAADAAGDYPHKPCYVLAATSGGPYRAAAPVHNTPDYASSHFQTVAGRLYAMAGLGPSEVDVLQSYENFTGGVLMAMVEHGFCHPQEVNDFFTLGNLTAPAGRLPLNTSGGNLAECYMHGLGLTIEAVRQIRGTGPNPVPDVEVSMMIGGPMVTPVSACIFGSAATL